MGQLASQGLGVLAIYFFLLFLLHFRLDFVQKNLKNADKEEQAGLRKRKKSLRKWEQALRKRKKITRKPVRKSKKRRRR